MGKVMIFAIVGLGLIAALYGMNSKQAMFEASSRVADGQYEVLARNAALAGFNIGRQKLAETFAGSHLSGTYSSGTYETDVVVAGNDAMITSTGTMGSARFDERTYEIQGRFEKVRVLHDHAPVFMEYAILSDADLELGGDMLAEVIVDGTVSSTLNANVHTNANLLITGNSVQVGGFGTFTGTGSGRPAGSLEGSFQPNYLPESDMPTAYHAEEVEIPELDIAEMTTSTNIDGTPYVDTYTASDVSLTGGTYSFGGTRENPYVWHIEGNLSLSGNTVIDGYVVFLVDGNVDVKGSVRVGETGYDGPEETPIGVYATGNVDLHGSAHLEGQVFAGGDVTLLRGTPEIVGGITTHGRLDIQGDPVIQFRPISTSITQPWQEPRYVFQMVGYYER
jgi:hypothetical protein